MNLSGGGLYNRRLKGNKISLKTVYKIFFSKFISCLNLSFSKLNCEKSVSTDRPRHQGEQGRFSRGVTPDDTVGTV